MCDAAEHSAQTVPTGPFYRKRIFVAVLNLFVAPIALLILWSGPVYYRRKGEVSLVRKRDKLGLTIVGLISFIFWCNRLAGPAGPATLPACDSSTAIATLKQTVEHSPAGRVHGLELLNVKQVHELGWSESSQVRQCSGIAALNDASSPRITFKLSWDDREKGLWVIEYQM
jgi:hypothetical protein